MRKTKKFLWIAVAVIVLAMLSVTFAFAAEGECAHPNGYSEWVNGCNVFICDDCGLNECDHSSGDSVLNEEGYYRICSNCGEILNIYCEHAEYEIERDDYWDNSLYNVYCDYEECTCGYYYKMGTKHQLVDYNAETQQYKCKLCGDAINYWFYEESKNLIVSEKDGTYSGEWFNVNRNTGEVSGEGTWTFDKNGVLTAYGKGEIDLGLIFRLFRAGDGEGKVCKYCVQAGISHDEETDRMIIREDEVIHSSGAIAEKLYKVVLGEGITSMHDISYDSAYALLVEELVLPDSFKGQWNYSEYGTYELMLNNATVKLPADTKLPDDGSVFIGNMIIDKNSPYYCTDEDGNIYSKDKTVLYKYQGSGKSFTVPSAVTKIAAVAFAMSNIEEVVLHSGVKEIGTGAFAYCWDLKNINIPAGVETIGEGAFAYSGIVKITLPYTVKSLGKSAFAYCFLLEEVKLPDGLESIPENAFAECFTLEEINIPASLKEIGRSAFSACFKLKSALVIPKTVEKIGGYAFEGCYSLKDVTVSSAELDFTNTGLGISGLDLSAISEIWNNEIFGKYYKSLFGKNQAIDYDKEKYNNKIAYIECIGNQLSTDLAYIEQKAYNDFLENGNTVSDILTIYCLEGSKAEAYAIENGIKYVTKVCEHSYGEWVADTEKGIKYKACSKCGKTYEEELEADDDIIDIEGNEGDNKFTVKLIENPEATEYIYIRGLLEGNIIALYDINLLDENGNKVQPDGMVKVSLPLDEEVTYFTVLRVNGDGTYTDMKAVREGNSVVFETDHFSYYVILGGENAEDTGNNIKCECLCHKNFFLEIIMKVFKFLAKFLGRPVSFPCDC